MLSYPDTGDDEDAENDGEPSNSKAKGKPGRKPAQKTKAQDADHENGKN